MMVKSCVKTGGAGLVTKSKLTSRARGPRSWARGLGSGAPGPGPWALGPRAPGPRAPGPPGPPGPGPWASGPGPWVPGPGPRALGLGHGPRAPGSEPRGDDDDQFRHLARLDSCLNVLLSYIYIYIHIYIYIYVYISMRGSGLLSSQVQMEKATFPLGPKFCINIYIYICIYI